MAMGDLDGDGHPDLVTGTTYNRSVAVLLGSSDGTFQAGPTFGVGSNARGTAVADLNSDGKLKSFEDTVAAMKSWPLRRAA